MPAMPARWLDRPPAALATQARFQCGGLLLALVVQLEIAAPASGAQLASVQRHLHRAARLAAVAAIGETTLLGKRSDVGEKVEVFLAGELQLAHARGIDQAAAAGQLQQGAMGGGVATAAIVAAHLGGGHGGCAEQGVGQGGLAGAGRTHQHRAVARLQVGCKQLRARRILAIERVDRRAVGQPLTQRGDLFGGILARIQFAQQHHRLRTGIFGQRQIALDPRRIEIAIQSGQHQDVIDIGGDQLALVALAGGGARQHAAPRRHGEDMRRRAVGHFHEVPDHRAPGRIHATPEKTTVRLCTEDGLAVMQLVAGAMLRDHPCQAQPVTGQCVATPADMPQPFNRFGVTHVEAWLAWSGDYALPGHGPTMNRDSPAKGLALHCITLLASTRPARELEAAGHDIIKLNIGNPGRYGFEAPAHLREAIASHLHDSEAYGHEQGLETAREAIAAQQRTRGARHVEAERIFIGNGVSELIDLALRALLQPGDEVLLPSPDYPLWSAATILNGGQPRYYRCLASHAHLPDPDEVEALITPRTRALVLINPNNPTGAVYPRALLQRLVEIAARHRLLLLADEIYDEILYDGATFQPLAELAGELPCLSFGGLSKVHRACGYRVGWMSLSGEPARSSVYRDALQLLAALRLCPNVTAQWAVLPALQDAPTIGALTAAGGRLHEARDTVLRGVAASRHLDLVAPAGALYAFPQVRAEQIPRFDDESFALRL